MHAFPYCPQGILDATVSMRQGENNGPKSIHLGDQYFLGMGKIYPSRETFDPEEVENQSLPLC